MNRSLIKHQDFRSGSPVTEAIIVNPSTSQTMSNPNADNTAKRSKTPWIIAGVAVLLLAGGGKWALGEIQELKAQVKSGNEKVAAADTGVETESQDSVKTAAAPMADVEFQKQLLDLQKQVSETQRKLAETEGAVRDRDKELAVRSEELKKQQESFEARVASAKTEAKTEFETSQAAKEEERRAALRKSKEVTIQDVDKNNLGEIQMDKSWKKGLWVPLTINNSGNPSPFGPAGAAPRKIARRGAEWKVVKDYPLENGQTVDAWAIVLGRNGEP